jgi:hypothetical protein
MTEHIRERVHPSIISTSLRGEIPAVLQIWRDFSGDLEMAHLTGCSCIRQTIPLPPRIARITMYNSRQTPEDLSPWDTHCRCVAGLPPECRYDSILSGYGGYGVGVNTSGCGPEDRGFKSHYSPKADGIALCPSAFVSGRGYDPKLAPIAQWIEYVASNHVVGGSNPSGRTKDQSDF